MPDVLSTSPSLHVCFVAHEYDQAFSSPEDLLNDYYSLTEWCEALQDKGCKVSAIVRFKKDAHLQRTGIDYYFVADSFGPQLRFWQVPQRMHGRVVEEKADVVHSHNFNKVLQHYDLAKRLRPFNTPLLLQNHAETPRFKLRSFLQKLLFRQIDGLLFCAKGQEEIWRQRGILSPATPIYYAMEGSTHFRVQDRQKARALSTWEGHPIFLWVGNLNANKDPLTILDAFEKVLPQIPQAQLYMVYRYDDLIDLVKKKIEGSSLLREKVHLLGPQKRSDLERLYNSADYFVLGSYREGSGYAAMEAMACGVVPILTDIPSYRMMTDQGRIGALWPAGNVAALVKAMEEVLEKPLEEQSVQVRAFFEQTLSYPTIAQQMLGYYREMIGRKERKKN